MAGDPDFASVGLLLHFNGTNGQTTTVDSSRSAKTVTRTGPNITLSSTQTKFGGTSSSTGSTFGNYWSVADSADWDFAAGPFTLECWCYITSALAVNTIMTQRQNNPNRSWTFGLSATGLQFLYTTDGSNAFTVSGTGTVPTNTWTHLCVDRDAGNTMRLYVDGVVIGSSSVSATLFDGSAALQVGGSLGSANAGYAGFIDDVRITKGVARYGGAFTPPTAAFPDAAPVAASQAITVVIA